MITKDGQNYIMNTYKRYPITLKNGKGCNVYDHEGNEYLDMISGIACCPLGHSNEAIKKAIMESADGFTNVSNLFYTEQQVKLAKKLVEVSGMEKCFFGNSGTEANEAALKLAIANTKKHEFIACKNAFHGRTFGSLSATWEKKYRTKFKPLVSKFKFVEYGNTNAIENTISDKTAAVIIEPIQGEAGIIVPPEDYLKEVQEICDKKGVLLIIDEVQTGNGRTGTYFEYLSHSIKPDIVTTAKGLANGLPMGVAIAKGIDFEPGDHASTFGGNSFVSSVALTTIETIFKENLMENAKNIGEYIKNEIQMLNKKSIKDIRGKGLMIGIELRKNAKEKVAEFISKKILISVVHEKTIRLLPPLIINKGEVENFISSFNEVVK